MRDEMSNSALIARHEIRSLFREKTFLLLLVVFAVMTVASAAITWSSQNTITQVYNAAARQIQQDGQVAPPSPFTDYPHLSLLKNMVIYINLIGGLLAITAGYAAGMRERKAGVAKLLFSRPIEKREYLLGKVLGIAVVIGLVLGFAVIISLVSSAVFVHLSVSDILGLLGFYALSFVYILGFAYLGLCFALVKEHEVIAFLIPIIFWIAITFVIPELTSALYPTSVLNPTLPQTDILQTPALQVMHNAVYPFSISEHYKTMASSILGVSNPGGGATELPIFFPAITLFSWLALCLASSYIAIIRFDKSHW
jgi:ABC-type transport system involved in multi-copper enzyme maturation permease subunit